MSKKAFLKWLILMISMINVILSSIFCLLLAIDLIGHRYICIVIPIWIMYSLPLIILLLFISTIYSFIITMYYVIYRITIVKNTKEYNQNGKE